MPPSKDDLKVAIKALRDAGKEWDQQSANLKEVASGMQALKMSHLEFGLVAPVQGVYEQVRAGLESRLNEAAHEAGQVGHALDHAAKVYQREEDAGVHALNKVW